ncbi:MAG: LysM peptidoglycan-binding domain-containing protein [Candidatus Omnitrophica bacterium]|nr:LysM peptidoglycan-binding domain-containing protein [Candidatus Omnitrophota bacterium]
MFQKDREMAFNVFIGIGVALLLTGCLKSVEVVTRDRVDQNLKGGNRGMIHGRIPTTPPKTSPTRTYLEWDVEIPTYEVAVRVPEWRREWEDKELWGNRGYLVGGPKRRPKEEELMPLKTEKPASAYRRSSYDDEEGEMEETLPPPPSAPSYTSYTVQKGETLGEISGKLYGTSKSWRRIYEANRDVLKDPDHLTPGQVLRIPQGGGPSKPTSRETIK